MPDIDDGARDQASRASEDVSAGAVRQQLERICTSKVFVQSKRLIQFLRYIADQAIAGRTDQLKEYTIGVEVFERDAAYDPRIDTIVRSEARRLRAKLKHYYESNGRLDPVVIEVPKGSYVPVFRRRDVGGTDWRLGSRVGHYEVIEKIGEGGMGVVYKGRDLSLDRSVALKFLAPHLLTDAGTKERLVREAQAAAAVDHPNVCTVHEIGDVSGETFVSMQYVEGVSLEQELVGRPLDVDRALDIATQTARGLRAAHRKQVVHRDIKPANLLLDHEGMVHIVDFGLAYLEGRSRLTREDAIVGTADYMSPEQVLGKQVDDRTDIWSLGATFYQMLTGRPPFDAEYSQAVAYGIVNEDPPALHELRPDVPKVCQAIVDRALAKDVQDRYSDVDALLGDLETARAVRQSDPIQEPVPPLPPEVAIPAEVLVPTRSRSTVVVLAVIAIVVVAAIFVATWLTMSQPVESPEPPLLTRVTSDSGLNVWPALSRDGSLLAYSSDRSGAGNLDLYVQQVGSTAEPLRLTDHQANDEQPHFSPDGRTIVFRSEREEGGIYTIPVLGGEPRLIAQGGRWPRFSPDGRWIAFHVDWPGELYVVDSGGGEPRRIQPGFANTRRGVWSPDSTRLVFEGQPDQDSAGFDWWVAPIEGGAAVRAGLIPALRENGIFVGWDWASPSVWEADPQGVLTSARAQDSTHLWRVPISAATGVLDGPLERLGSGAGHEAQPTVAAAGLMAFAGLQSKVDVWALPIDTDLGEVEGDLERLTDNAANDIHPHVSQDGSRLVFISRRSGRRDIWSVDLNTKKRRPLTDRPAHEHRVKISGDGANVVYTQEERDGRLALYRVSSAGGVPKEICGECGNVMSVSFDGGRVIYSTGRAYESRWFLLDVASGESTELFDGPPHRIYSPEFSPDGKWLAFVGSTAREPGRMMGAPLVGSRVAPESEWVSLSETSVDLAGGQWSSDGRLLYFVSHEDGSPCLWAQRLDPASKKPIDTAFVIHHFHQTRFAPMHPAYRGLSVARDKIVLGVEEKTGTIWLSEPRNRSGGAK